MVDVHASFRTCQRHQKGEARRGGWCSYGWSLKRVINCSWSMFFPNVVIQRLSDDQYVCFSAKLRPFLFSNASSYALYLTIVVKTLYSSVIFHNHDVQFEFEQSLARWFVSTFSAWETLRRSKLSKTVVERVINRHCCHASWGQLWPRPMDQLCFGIGYAVIFSSYRSINIPPFSTRFFSISTSSFLAWWNPSLTHHCHSHRYIKQTLLFHLYHHDSSWC